MDTAKLEFLRAAAVAKVLGSTERLLPAETS